MAREKESVKLREVDESVDENSHFYRLHKGAAEEIDNLPPVKVSAKIPLEARLEAVGKDGLKMRSIEPDVSSLIERNAEEREKQEAEWENAAPSKGIPWGWLVVIGGVFATGILWSLVEVSRSDERRDIVVESAMGILEQEREEEMEAEKLISTLEKTVRDFFDSRSVDEMLRYVRHPERVEPLMGKFYSATPPVPQRVKSIRSFDPLTVGHSATFWMVVCELADGTDGQVLLEALPGNLAKVDWETFVCYQPMEWDRLVSERPGGYSGDFRVYVEQDNFYNYEFSDSERYASYRLTTLNSAEVLYGYVDRETTPEIADELEQLTSKDGANAISMILRLEVPENARSQRGLFVKKILAKSWLYVDPPEVER